MQHLFIYTPSIVSPDFWFIIPNIPHCVEHCLGAKNALQLSDYFLWYNQIEFSFHDFYIHVAFPDNMNYKQILEYCRQPLDKKIIVSEIKMLTQELSQEQEKIKILKKLYSGSVSFSQKYLKIETIISYHHQFFMNPSWVLMKDDTIKESKLVDKIIKRETNWDWEFNIMKYKDSKIVGWDMSSLKSYALMLFLHELLSHYLRYTQRYLYRISYDYDQVDFFQTRDKRYLIIPQSKERKIDELFFEECRNYLLKNFNNIYDSQWKGLYFLLKNKEYSDEDLLWWRKKLSRNQIKTTLEEIL